MPFSWGGISSSGGPSQYVSPTGRAGGQSIFGGTNAGDNLVLDSTSHATKGLIVNSSSAKFNSQVFFASEIDNGYSGTTKTIDWTAGNKHKLTLTGNCVLSFVNPSGPTNLILKLVQDTVGGRSVTWPASVKWPNNAAPTLTSAANKVDVATMYFDGTNYFCTIGLNYTV